MVDNFAPYQKTLNKTFLNAMQRKKLTLKDDEYDKTFKVMWRNSNIAQNNIIFWGVFWSYLFKRKVLMVQYPKQGAFNGMFLIGSIVGFQTLGLKTKQILLDDDAVAIMAEKYREELFEINPQLIELRQLEFGMEEEMNPPIENIQSFDSLDSFGNQEQDDEYGDEYN